MGASELIIFKDHSDLDVTNKVYHYQYEDTLTEEVPSLILKLPAKRGRYLTSTPIVQHFDRIYAKLTDKNGDSVEDVFEVLKIKPTELPNQGRMVELYCTHQSWYVWQNHFAKQYRRESGFEVVEDILSNSYNFSAGSSQPTVRNPSDTFNPSTGLGNDMSKATFNIYDFGNSEKKDYDGILDVIDRLGAPISAGGEFEFYEIRFRSAYNHGAGTNLDKIDVAIFPSGFKNGSLVTVDKDDLLNKVYDTDGNLEAETGFIIGSWGESDTGSLPVSVSQYFSEKEFFNIAKDWDGNSIKYKAGMRVQYQGSFYVAIIDHTSSAGSPPTATIGTLWNVDTFSPSIDYSKMTKDKAQYWINSALGHLDAGTPGGRAAIFDGNVVIRDDNHRRTIVDVVENDSANLAALTYLQKPSGNFPIGFRVLVNGTGLNDFAGNDSSGKPFSNNIAQWDGSKWFVFLEAENDFEVVDWLDGKAWTYQPCLIALDINDNCSGGRFSGWQWGSYDQQKIFRAERDFDCMHRYTILGVNNPDFGNTDGIEPAPHGTNSAVRIKFDYTAVNPLDEKSVNQIFCGINIKIPFPPSSIGVPWGAVDLGAVFLQDLIDRNNMHLSSKDQRGFAQGVDSDRRGAEDFGFLSSFRAWMKPIFKNIVGGIIGDGDFTWRMAIGDISDNVVTIDRPHPHNNNWEEISWGLNGAEIYRARPGLPFLPLKELEVLNRFEWWNIKWISIYILDFYDDQGRFAGQLSRPYNFPTFSGGSVGGTAELQIDAPHWVKPLLSISHLSETRPSRNLQPQFKNHPQIFNKKQNDNVVLAWKEFHAFKKVEYNIRTVFRCDIKSGEHFYYTNDKLINTTTDAKQNTEKLVAKKIIYTRTKGKGRGGRQRYIVGSKRFIA